MTAILTDARRAELERTIADLRELIEALDRRIPQVERSGEVFIANTALILRSQAIARLREIESQMEARPGEQTE